MTATGVDLQPTWPDVLKGYIDQRLADLDRRYTDLRITDKESLATALTAANAAISKAETLVDKRFTEADQRLQQRWEADQKGIAAALQAAKEAVDKAERAQELRNEVANEFRQTLADQANTFWTIKEGQSALFGTDAKLSAQIEANRREREAVQSDLRAQLALLGNKVQPLDTMISQMLTMSSEINLLRTTEASLAGRHSGVSDLTGRAIAVIAVLASVIALILNFTR